MTFLEIVQEVARLCGGTTAPTTTVSQTGESLRFVNWVIRSWEDIQNMHVNWHFLRRPLSFTTSSSQSYTTAVMDATYPIHQLDYDSLRIYTTATGVSDEQHLEHIVSWDEFRDRYLFGARATGRPQYYSVDPSDKTLYLNSNPGTGYTIVGNFFRTPILWAAATDAALTPAMPSNFHMLVVYRAMLKYAGYEAAAEAKQEAAENFAPMLGALRRDQLPRIRVGRELA